MSSQPNLAAHFAAMETLVESYPEGVNAEIAKGVFMMTPRQGVRQSATQGRLLTVLHERLGRGDGTHPPEWLFLIEPEIRSETAFSRLIPDLAGWRRSAGGWPDTEVNPVGNQPGEGCLASNLRLDQKEPFWRMGPVPTSQSLV